MEITSSSANPSAPGYVTLGLLTREMITGQVQIGDKSFRADGPANIDVAGDLDDTAAPTYASLARVLGNTPIPQGWSITQTIDRADKVTDNSSYATYGVTSAHLVAQTRPQRSLSLLGLSELLGPGYGRGSRHSGFPLQQPAGDYRLSADRAVLDDCQARRQADAGPDPGLERRILTYTPSNADGWKVESNNAGEHYFDWRYGAMDGSSTPLNAAAVEFARRRRQSARARHAAQRLPYRLGARAGHGHAL